MRRLGRGRRIAASVVVVVVVVIVIVDVVPAALVPWGALGRRDPSSCASLTLSIRTSTIEYSFIR